MQRCDSITGDCCNILYYLCSNAFLLSAIPEVIGRVSKAFIQWSLCSHFFISCAYIMQKSPLPPVVLLLIISLVHIKCSCTLAVTNNLVIWFYANIWFYENIDRFYFMNGTYLQYGTKIYMKVKNQVKLFIKTVSHFMSSVSFVQYNGAAEFDYWSHYFELDFFS